MQWIKDKVRGNGVDGTPDARNNFIVGSDKWIGSSQNSAPVSTPMAPLGSFKNPEAARTAVQEYNPQPNPYVQHAQPASLGNDLPANDMPKETSGKPLYPNVYDNSDKKQSATESNNGRSDEEEVELLTGTQVLVTIPGAIVHLIDDEESVHLATGDFTLVRLVQESTRLVVIAKVGEELKWPLAQQVPTVKLDPSHYFFSLKVPKDNDNVSSKVAESGSETDEGRWDTLNYGVTFPVGVTDDQAARIRELDYYLGRYSTFSAPTVVQGLDNEIKQSESVEKLPPPQDPSFPGKVIQAETISGDGKMVTEETSAAFWTTVAPNVNEYNSSIAKGIASGAGHIIRGIFWLSDSTVEQLESGRIYMTTRFKSKTEASKISPITMASVRSARRLSSMTDKVTKGVLGGIVYTTGLLSNAVIKSPPGRMFFKLLPGEVALVSLDAFGRIFDAVELAGTDVMARTSSVTQDFVNHRYGESAKELTDESFRAVGHAAATAWNITKLRKALNPKNMKYSKTAIAKSLAKSAAGVNKKT